MKVIFLKDVPRVAQRDMVKDVADGYALNALIPKGLAEQATPAKLAAWQERMKKAQAQSAARDAQYAALLDTLKGARITITAKGNDKGHLYTQLAPQVIVDAIKHEHKADVPADAIGTKKPIKDFGEHAVEIKLGGKSVAIAVVVARG